MLSIEHDSTACHIGMEHNFTGYQIILRLVSIKDKWKMVETNRLLTHGFELDGYNPLREF